MKRTYHKWHSPILHKEMELLVFGETGAKVIFFPPRMSRFYDYENWHLIDILKEKINQGFIQVFCVDSIDGESLYNVNIPPKERILRHIHYEQYIIQEVIPFTQSLNTTPFLIAAGCSLGAYHAVNIALKHPKSFNKVVGMSGRYDINTQMAHYHDLFDGYFNEDIYFNLPNIYMKNLHDENWLDKIRKLDIILAVGHDDPCLKSNEKLNQTLHDKNIHSSLYIWNGDGHRACFWREMIQIYL